MRRDTSISIVRQIVRRAVPRRARNLARAPLAAARWAWNSLLWRAGRRPRIEAAPGWHVRCHPASAIAFKVHRDVEEFRAELAAFAATCRPDMVLVDVGAHFGVFTLAALHYGQGGSRVVAVEPSAPCRRVLRANIALSHQIDRVQIVPSALGATDGPIAALTTGAGGHHMLMKAEGDRVDARSIPGVAMDTLVAQIGLVPTHVKVDVEGFEDEVLRGAEGTLRRHQPIILLELHNAMLRQLGRDPRALLVFLNDCGYATFDWHGRPLAAGDICDLPIARLVCRAGTR